MTTLKIATAAQSTIDVIGAGKPILEQVASYMDAAEELKNSTLTGAEKREWVIEFVKKEIAEVASNLSYWIPIILKFITAVKTAFNALKVLF